jgi:hypothetical protein
MVGSIESAPAPRRNGRAAWLAGGLTAAALLVLALVGMARLARRPASIPVATTPTATATVPTPVPVAVASTPPIPAAVAPVASIPPTPTTDPHMSTLLVSCNPPCDSIWVDGHPAPEASSGKPMPPGVHMIGANLAHHPSKVEPVLLKRGEVTRIEVDFGR